ATGVKRRSGGVFEVELQRLGVAFSSEFGRNYEGEVNACGDASSGECIPVSHDARAVRNCAKQRKHVAIGPVAGRTLAIEEARCAEHKRTVADGSVILRAGGQSLELAHEGRVVYDGGRLPAGDEQQVTAFDFGHSARTVKS